MPALWVLHRGTRNQFVSVFVKVEAVIGHDCLHLVLSDLSANEENLVLRLYRRKEPRQLICIFDHNTVGRLLCQVVNAQL